LTKLRQFLGLTNYFRKFIKNYSIIAAPLTNLTRKGGFASLAAWTPACQQAFEELTRIIADDVTLSFPDYSLPFRVEVISDASLHGSGAVLLQEGRPIAETQYMTGGQELLAALEALKEWRCYFEGRPFTLKTNHKLLTFLQSVPTLNRRQARWMEYLSRFDCTWEYITGRINIADALSRHPSLHAAILAAPVTRSRSQEVPIAADLAQRFKMAYQADPWFASPSNVEHLYKHNNLWLRKDGLITQIVVPNDNALHYDILARFHEDPLAGHPGSTRLAELVRRSFWWPLVVKDAENFVQRCSLCQRNKALSGQSPSGRCTSIWSNGLAILASIIRGS
ncbi:hypothetical protein VaNZ11_007941, partial [Volvox africanus]